MDRMHDHLHRRHARAAIPSPEANASATANALADGFAIPQAAPQDTLVSIVYVTASKTFAGPVGGYTTLGVAVATSAGTPDAASSDPTLTQDANLSQAPSSAALDPESILADTSSHAKSQTLSTAAETTLQPSSSTGLPASIVPTASVASTLAIAVATSSSAPTSPGSTLSSIASAASSTSSTSTSSGGMSAAGKVGLAIGILLLLGTALAVILFFFKKRKDAMKGDRLDDEKTEVFAGAGRAASTRTTATAPRLSLRPVTQFLPNLGVDHQSRGNVLAMATQAPASNQQGPTHPPDSNRINPFGAHAETIDADNARGPTVVTSVGPGGVVVTDATRGATADAVGLARGASKRENQPKQIDFTKSPFKRPSSPARSEFSISSEPAGTFSQTPQGAAIAAAGGPANSSVHRVQLDFKPSMDDELELRAGQLIRLLHEYDDGWALCIRLDHSAQGVVPRTCLSTRPVKPRPQQNGPRGPPSPGMRISPQGRPISPAMNQGPPRAMSPASNRPMTPLGRPMTPIGPGPMSPQFQAQPRSLSPAQMQPQTDTQPGHGPMNPVAEPDAAGSPPLSRSPPTDGSISRKPVGQAF